MHTHSPFAIPRPGLHGSLVEPWQRRTSRQLRRRADATSVAVKVSVMFGGDPNLFADRLKANAHVVTETSDDDVTLVRGHRGKLVPQGVDVDIRRRRGSRSGATA